MSIMIMANHGDRQLPRNAQEREAVAQRYIAEREANWKRLGFVEGKDFVSMVAPAQSLAA